MVDVQAFFKNRPTLRSKESMFYGRTFKTKPTDVMVVTSPKCGTTWVTHICHLLRSNGEEVNGTFDRRVPWDIMAMALGIDLEADQGFEPRLFKSHETMDDIAKGAKYLIVFRDPLDAFMSYYKMMLIYLHVSSEELNIEDFAEHFLTQAPRFGTPGKFTNSALNSYETNSASILFLHYEDLLQDRMASVRKIAQFMGLDGTLTTEEFEERCEVAFAKSSFKYMKEHPEATEARELLKHADKVTKIKEKRENFSITVNQGKAGGGKNLPESVKELLRSDWKEHVEANHGYKSYQDFRHSNR